MRQQLSLTSQHDLTAWEPIYAQLLREWIETGEPAWVSLIGRCMNPFLPGGSKVLVSKAAAGQVVCGDLLVYEEMGRLICHRVLRRRAYRGSCAFLTKGDSWRAIASWIHHDQVIGKVITVERGGRVLRLDTPIHRLHAMGAVVRSLVVAGSLPVLRWGKQILKRQLKLRCAGTA